MHRNDVDSKHCDYGKQWNQEEVTDAVTEIIKNLIHNPKFESAIRKKIESSVDTTELEAKTEALNKQLKQQIGAKNKLGQQKISGDNVYRYLLYFDKLYDKFTDKEKKQFMNSFINRIEIYEDVLPSGRFLKSIHFKFPIFY